MCGVKACESSQLRVSHAECLRVGTLFPKQNKGQVDHCCLAFVLIYDVSLFEYRDIKKIN